MSTANPASPVVLGELTLPGAIPGLAAGGNRVYAIASPASLVVVDVADPSQPRTLHTLDLSGQNEAGRLHIDDVRTQIDRALDPTVQAPAAAAGTALDEDLFDVSVDPESCWVDYAIRRK